MKILCIVFDDIDINGLRPSFSNAQLLSLNGSCFSSSRALFVWLYFAEYVAKIQFCDAFCSGCRAEFYSRDIVFSRARKLARRWQYAIRRGIFCISIKKKGNKRHGSGCDMLNNVLVLFYHRVLFKFRAAIKFQTKKPLNSLREMHRCFFRSKLQVSPRNVLDFSITHCDHVWPFLVGSWSESTNR